MFVDSLVSVFGEAVLRLVNVGFVELRQCGMIHGYLDGDLVQWQGRRQDEGPLCRGAQEQRHVLDGEDSQVISRKTGQPFTSRF